MCLMRGKIGLAQSKNVDPSRNRTDANRCPVPAAGMAAIDWVSHLGIVSSFAGLWAFAGFTAREGPSGLLPLWICPWKRLSGLPCPTCGMVRSLAAVLHGEWTASLAFHPLVPILIPALACLSFLCVRGMIRRRPVHLGSFTAWALALLGTASWIAKLASPVSRW